MNFSDALEELKAGKKIKRSGWGGYWFIPMDITIVHEKKVFDPAEFWIIAKLKDCERYVPATPYQSDLLADDWEVFLTLEEQQNSCSHEFKPTGFGVALTSNPPQYRVEWRCDKCGKTDLRSEL